MNFSKKNHEIARQNDLNVKKPQKHDANLQKNTTLYFQIGLILCLLFTYTMFDMQFLVDSDGLNKGKEDTNTDEVFIINIKDEPKYVAVVEPQPVVKKRVQVVNVIKPVKNDFVPKKELPTIDVKAPVIEIPVDAIIKKTPPVKKTPSTLPFDKVEQAPIFPGCEGLNTNAERKACMSKKITKHVQRKFNTDIAVDMGLSGKQRIYVQFKIDESGNVTEIKSRSPHARLQNEATRVIDKLPQMEPGKQRKENVTVMYTLPITFQVYD